MVVRQHRYGRSANNRHTMANNRDGAAAKDSNPKLVRIFSLCLCTLVFFYSVLACRQLLLSETIDGLFLLLTLLRMTLGAAVLTVIIYPSWLARPLERQIETMGRRFEAGFAGAGTKEKLKLIVLVTMVSLLLELVMIRWLAAVFPVFSFFKNFTLLACFLGLGAGYAVAEKQRCAPALVLPMLALFVAVITLLRYDLGAGNGLFTAIPMHEQSTVGVPNESSSWFGLLQWGVQVSILYEVS